MKDGVMAQVAALPAMPIKELKAMWRDLYGKEPPPYNRAYIVKRLAYRIQELAYGGLSEAARFKMRAILDEIGADALASPRGGATGKTKKRRAETPVVGTRLVREWHGERHEVTVVEGGFAYSGQRYRSLSAIARAITGTQWNGWVFFRLKQPNGTNGT
jgi:hypothetical protein